MGLGFYTLLQKELLRFWKVSFQTIAAPVFTILLYLLIFSYVLREEMIYSKLSYQSFLIPGLIVMSIMQNAFANPSSSLIQSRISGNMIFILLPPLSHWEIFGGYVAAAMVRGLLVGISVWIAASIRVHLVPENLEWVVIFAILSSATMGVLGFIAGLWSEKFDHLAAFQNFVIMPITFLSGVFYSIHNLPPFWCYISYWNPIFYAVDGFRYGFVGISDVSPWRSLIIVTGIFALLSLFALCLLARGYKLRQ